MNRKLIIFFFVWFATIRTAIPQGNTSFQGIMDGMKKNGQNLENRLDQLDKLADDIHASQQISQTTYPFHICCRTSKSRIRLIFQNGKNFLSLEKLHFYRRVAFILIE